MFVDACAIIAILSDEPEAARVAAALSSHPQAFTSPVAVLEVVTALARPDKFNISTQAAESLVRAFLEARRIEIRDMPPASDLTRLALDAMHRFRSGRHGLNLGDCLHYACARHHDAPILATADEFRQTDLVTIE
ncbi:type II toxin-antitoxin system VapC family toxin [Oryzibacter oryziterrae]|uniref:type II toxin-antitoxin system VapC family toxin n=1 Tax=Oryzibacter oryziterrae TaxID=2766474 RepID=UPI001F2D4D91|nr:type II toxin-antitoxin system VapC family toxin [Oryzibacter oryziterrae]